MEICIQQKKMDQNSMFLLILAFNYLKTQSPKVFLHYKNITMVIHKLTIQTVGSETYLQKSTYGGKWKELMWEPNVGGKGEQCREGPKAKLEQFLI